MGSASDWSCCLGNLLQSIRSPILWHVISMEFLRWRRNQGWRREMSAVVAVRLRFPPDSSPVVSLCLSLVARGVWWEGWKRERESSSLFSSHHPLLPPRALREDDWGRVRVSSFYSSWLSMKMIESLTLVNSSNVTLESCCRLLLVRIPAISSSTWSSASAGPVTILNKLNNSWYDNCPSPSLSKTWNATAVNQW